MNGQKNKSNFSEKTDSPLADRKLEGTPRRVKTEFDFSPAIENGAAGHSTRIEKTKRILVELFPAIAPYTTQQVLDRVEQWEKMVKQSPHRNAAPFWWEVLQALALQQKKIDKKNTQSIDFDKTPPFFYLDFWERIFVRGVLYKTISLPQWLQVPEIQSWIFDEEEDTVSSSVALGRIQLRLRARLAGWYQLKPASDDLQQIGAEFLKADGNCLPAVTLMHVIDGWETWEDPSRWSQFLHLQKCELCLKKMRTLRLALAQLQEVIP